MKYLNLAFHSSQHFRNLFDDCRESEAENSNYTIAICSRLEVDDKVTFSRNVETVWTSVCVCAEWIFQLPVGLIQFRVRTASEPLNNSVCFRFAFHTEMF